MKTKLKLVVTSSQKALTSAVPHEVQKSTPALGSDGWTPEVTVCPPLLQFQVTVSPWSMEMSAGTNVNPTFVTKCSVAWLPATRPRLPKKRAIDLRPDDCFWHAAERKTFQVKSISACREHQIPDGFESDDGYVVR